VIVPCLVAEGAGGRLDTTSSAGAFFPRELTRAEYSCATGFSSFRCLPDTPLGLLIFQLCVSQSFNGKHEIISAAPESQLFG
jgi:hypothetical protein